MKRPKKTAHFWVSICSCLLLLVVAGCSVSYSFNGSSVDYALTRTISISDFPIRSDYVYAPLGIAFNQGLTDIFARQTKLKQINKGGDLELKGEITGYRQINQAVKTDGYASEVKLEMEVNVRFINNKKHEEDFDKKFTAYRTYDATQTLASVQDDLIAEMVKDITEQIFNATVANW